MRLLLALLLACWAAVAHGQIAYSPTPGSGYQPLDGATISGKVSIRLQGCMPPVTFVLDDDAAHAWVENSAPCDWQGDPNLWDSATVTDGAHTMAVAGQTAGFTVTNSTSPAPPVPVGSSGPTLTWTAPTQNEDGTPLTDLAGYRIYYGRTSEPDQMLALSNPGLTAHTFDGLAAGMWYFAMTALNAAGTESARTQIVSTTVAAPAPAPAPAWIVAPTTTNTRPVYEAVLKVDGGGLKRGNREGSIPVGKPCGDEAFARLRYSYRDVTESDVTLTSPTYRGRHHVAICVLPQ